jgi:hypothetical protein
MSSHTLPSKHTRASAPSWRYQTRPRPNFDLGTFGNPAQARKDAVVYRAGRRLPDQLPSGWGSSDCWKTLPSGPSRRETVRALLARGVLSPFTDLAWPRAGSERPCAVCLQPVLSTEVEYVVLDGSDNGAVVHGDCFTVWEEESRLL